MSPTAVRALAKRGAGPLCLIRPWSFSETACRAFKRVIEEFRSFAQLSKLSLSVLLSSLALALGAGHCSPSAPERTPTTPTRLLAAAVLSTDAGAVEQIRFSTTTGANVTWACSECNDGSCEIDFASKSLRGRIPVDIGLLACKERVTSLYAPSSDSRAAAMVAAR